MLETIFTVLGGIVLAVLGLIKDRKPPANPYLGASLESRHDATSAALVGALNRGDGRGVAAAFGAHDRGLLHEGLAPDPTRTVPLDSRRADPGHGTTHVDRHVRVAPTPTRSRASAAGSVRAVPRGAPVDSVSERLRILDERMNKRRFIRR